MSIKLPKLGLNGEIDPCLESAIDLLNENAEIIDLTSSFSVERGPALPGTASTGDAFLVDGDNTIYYWTDSWQSFTPSEGLFIYDQTNDEPIVFDGTSWQALSAFLNPVTASNEGSGVEVFKQKTGDNLEFRTLTAGSNISFNQTADEIEISSSGGGSGSGGFTEVSTQDYVIQASDNNIAIAANFNIRLIMPDPTLFPGRKIRFFINNLGASNTVRLRDHTDSVDLFTFRLQDVESIRFPGGGSNQRAVPFIEFMSYTFTTQGNIFWGISDFSDKIKSERIALSLLTVNGSDTALNPEVIFTKNLGSTELFESINISSSFKVEFSGSNSTFVFRYDTRLDGGSWTIGKAYSFNYNSNLEKILYLDETITPAGSGVNQLLEVRLVAYRFAGTSSLTIGDSTVGALITEVVVRKEL
jgi:hypothetical protein